MNLTYERAKRASKEFGDKVTFQEIDTLDKANSDEWGIVDAVYIDDKKLRTGPPPSYKKIKKVIGKKVKKLK